MNEITGPARDALILQVLNRIEADEQRIGVPERTKVWERGWQEALDKFRAAPSADSLIPAFIRTGQPVRLHQSYWQPSDAWHELNYIRTLQAGSMMDAFEHCSYVYEFGCGTGFNLVALATQDQNKTYHGFDFVQPAVNLVKEAGFALDLPVSASLFDMVKPNGRDIHKEAGIFTFGAIEQLAGRFHAFIDYLLSQKPSIVLHIEPVIELYDPTNLIDALAIRFHRKRGYTEGLLPYLQTHPDIEVLEVKRAHFGSLMLEGYNRILWQPR